MLVRMKHEAKGNISICIRLGGDVGLMDDLVSEI